MFLLTAIEELVSTWVENALPFPSWFGTVLTGGLVALAVAPLRHHINKLASKVLPERQGGSDVRDAVTQPPGSALT